MPNSEPPEALGLLGKAKDVVEQYLIEPTDKKFGTYFVAGIGSSQVVDWIVECVAKAGTIAIVGVSPPTDRILRSARP